MEEWFRSAIEGNVQRKNTSLIVLAPDGVTEQLRWNFEKAWISAWSGAEFDASGNGVAIESMTMVADKMERAGGA